MKSKKFIKRSVAMACAFAAFATTAVGCGKKSADGEQVLEIFLWEAGYGTQWLYDMSDAFKAQDWVKAKYPELKIIIDPDSDNSKATTLLDAGEKGGNTVDLFFGANLQKYTGVGYDGKEIFADLTETVFNQQIPGESQTVYDKMWDSALEGIRYYEKGQDSNSPNVPFKTYIFPWVGGMNSILYNADHLETLGLEMPLTTNQLIAACQAAKDSSLSYNLTSKEGNYAILTDSSGNYWDTYYNTWWGQYEGLDEYYNFFNGFDGVGLSYKVHEQKGKLYSLKVLENLLKWDNGYVYKGRTGYDYMAAQTQFLSGDAVFYCCGDWYADEMKEVAADLEAIDEYVANIRLMKNPIVSEIIELTPTLQLADGKEDLLIAVIKAIDAGYTTQEMAMQASFYNEASLGLSTELQNKCAEISDEDYAKILDARSIISSSGTRDTGCVPTYAKGKEIAFDFLKFMATDEAQDIYTKATSGSNLPFKYDVKAKNPTLYNSLPQISKDRADIFSNTTYDVQILPDHLAFPLVRFGGMSAVHSTGGSSLVNYFISKGANASAQQLWEDDIEYYETAFNNCLKDAGLA